MHPFLENELNESVEKLKDNQVNFTKKQTDIIKSLPEEERLKIFKSMYANKKETSAYQMWKDLRSGWRVFIKVVILITLIVCVLLFGTENGWKNFEEFMQVIGYFYN